MAEKTKDPNCPLCQHKRLTYHYHEDHMCWIADCQTCQIPMLVYNWHFEPSEAEIKHMVSQCYRVFGENINFRKEQRQIKNHWHWHIVTK